MRFEGLVADYDKTINSPEGALIKQKTPRRIGRVAVTSSPNKETEMRHEKPHFLEVLLSNNETLLPISQEEIAQDEELTQFIESVWQKGGVELLSLENFFEEKAIDEESRVVALAIFDVLEIEVLGFEIPNSLPNQTEESMNYDTREFVDPSRHMLNYSSSLGLLTGKQEIELARRIQAGDEAAKKQMIEQNLLLVASYAQEYVNMGLEREDLIMEGVKGLIRATEKFDPERGFRFSTYATWWIRQAMQRGVAKTARIIHIPPHVLERRQRLIKAERKIFKEGGVTVALEELSMETGIPMKQATEAWYIPEALTILNSSVGFNDDSSELGDFIENENVVIPHEDAVLEERKRAVEAALGVLTETERRVIEMRFGLKGVREHQVQEVVKALSLRKDEVFEIQSSALQKIADSYELNRVIEDSEFERRDWQAERKEYKKRNTNRRYRLSDGKEVYLSDHDFRVFELLEQDKTYAEAAKILDVNELTIKSQILQVYKGLGLPPGKGKGEAIPLLKQVVLDEELAA
jgi:RNA polymerase primary sigma factor